MDGRKNVGGNLVPHLPGGCTYTEGVGKLEDGIIVLPMQSSVVPLLRLLRS